MKILIVGAGIWGLTLANFCQKNKIDFDIIEKEKNTKHHWFSIGIWSNGREILKKLRLHKNFDTDCIKYEIFKLHNSYWDSIYTHDLDEFRSWHGTSYSHIKRYNLIKILCNNLEKDIKFNTQITSIKNKKSEIFVKFSDNNKKKYDLLVACDGVHSKIRENFFKSTKESYLTVWWYLVDTLWLQKKTVNQYTGNGTFVSIFPEPNNKDLVVLLLKDSIYKKEHDVESLFWEHTQIKHIFKKFKGHKSKIYTIVTNNWYKNRIVLLGDAAHAMPPFGGLGGSMAMEDAFVLSDEINNNKNIDDALKKYEYRRKRRVQLAAIITHRMQFWTTLRYPYNLFFEKILKIIPKSFFTKKYHKLFIEKNI